MWIKKFILIGFLSALICPLLSEGEGSEQKPDKKTEAPVEPKDPEDPKETPETKKDEIKVVKTTIEFKSEDELLITADLYVSARTTDDMTATPLIILCHQARGSRGEYKTIAPRLCKIGYNCLAIDQRSGMVGNGIENKTFKRAKKKKLETTYLEAEQDIRAAVVYARKKILENNKTSLILWGSSYSASLVIRVKGDDKKDKMHISGLMCFSPGEYFARFGKHKKWVALAALEINDIPVFLTGARKEHKQLFNLRRPFKTEDKIYFRPKKPGDHGSKALFEKSNCPKEYWKAVEDFLGKYFPLEE